MIKYLVFRFRLFLGHPIIVVSYGRDGSYIWIENSEKDKYDIMVLDVPARRTEEFTLNKNQLKFFVRDYVL